MREDSGGVAYFLRHGGGGSHGWTTYGVAGSELSVGTHYLIQSPGQAFGIPVLEMRNLMGTHEKFKEVRYSVQAFMLGSWKSNPGLSNCLACALNAFLGFLWILG